MICLHAKNEKLDNRAMRLFAEATGETDPARMRETITQAGGRLDVAILMYKSGKSREQAEAAMASRGDFRQALLNLTGVPG